MEQVQDLFYDTTFFGNLGFCDHVCLQVVAQQAKVHVQRYRISHLLVHSDSFFSRSYNTRKRAESKFEKYEVKE